MTTLLIGTTGMLADAVRALARDTAGDIVAVARRAGDFCFDDPVLDARLHAHAADWSDQPAFLSGLDAIAARHGAVSKALVWMHGRDEPLRAHVAHHMARGGTLVEVLGSAASRPGGFSEVRLRQMRAMPHIRYRQVLLGFVHENGQSRWLTHDEICAAVVSAFHADDEVTIAGIVEPWELRP